MSPTRINLLLIYMEERDTVVIQSYDRQQNCKPFTIFNKIQMSAYFLYASNLCFNRQIEYSYWTALHK